MKTIYAVMTNSDRTEGRGKEFPIGFSFNKFTAYRIGKGNYVQGCDCPIREIPILEYEGKEYIYLYNLDITPPTKQDIDNENQMKEKEQLIKKAKDLGLSDEEIEKLRQ